MQSVKGAVKRSFVFMLHGIIVISYFLLSNSSGSVVMAEEEDHNIHIVMLAHSNKVWIQHDQAEKVTYISHDDQGLTPIMKNQRVLVPLRFMTEVLGADVHWNNQEKIAQITWNSLTMNVSTDSSIIETSSGTIESDAVPMIDSHAVFVPLRVIGEFFGYDIRYERSLIIVSTQMVDIEAIPVDHIFEQLQTGYSYQVVKEEETIEYFIEDQDAQAFSSQHPFSWVENRLGEVTYRNFPAYAAVGAKTGEPVAYFDFFDEALAETKKHFHSQILYENQVVWESDYALPSAHRIKGIPLIGQFPELPRGCEVTSLAMLLQYHEYDVDKMTLAQEVSKVPFLKDGFRGNPYDGFVGNMYTYEQHGLGVFHGPIVSLAQNYMGERVADLTGSHFDEILYQVSQDRPVWVIVTSTYDIVPQSRWSTWHTTSGQVQITYSQHSVIITGYDESYIYMNDPFLRHTKVPIDRFKNGWKQYGSQAMTIF